jgi:2-phospho-L-lactate guanylyltransferase
MSNICAVVPVKPFAAAKQRLSPVLSRPERAELARLMLEDVLDVLATCMTLSGTLVVTADDAACQIAHAGGAMVLGDPMCDLNASLREAIEYLSARCHTGMIVVPSDIPLLGSSLLEIMIEQITSTPAIALVPASHDGGTNLLACSPAGAIRPSFGPDSFRRHCRAARGAGIEPAVITSDDAGLDIDRPDDLAGFLSRRSATRSQAFLAALGVGTRLRDAGHDARLQFLKA